MNLIVKNQSIASPSYDAPANGCSKIVLGDGQSVDYPINATLGGESGVSASAHAEFSPSAITNGYNAYSDGTVVAGYGIIAIQLDTTYVDTIFRVDFDTLINTGSITIDKYYNGSTVEDLPSPIALNNNGKNYIEIEISNIDMIYLYPTGGDIFNIDFTNFSTKEVTTPNSYAYYCKAD